MNAQQTTIHKGLEGIIVDRTAIAKVEGAIGRLSYRGIDIKELTAAHSFVDCVWLVLFGSLPSTEQARALDDFLVRSMAPTDSEQRILAALPRSKHPMEILQGLTPLIDRRFADAPALPVESTELAEGLVIAARLAGILAAWQHLRHGESLPVPDRTLGFQANFLLLFSGRRPTVQALATLQVTQILQMEHGFNASTFAARVATSTLAPVQAVLSAAIGTLSGPLHGGADEAALQMALEIGAPANAADYVRQCLAQKRRIMGMGHREYKTVDPRARILKPMAERLCSGSTHETLFKTLVAVEEAVQQAMAQRGRKIHANVEFYKGAVMNALGIPSDFFTSMFAIGRVYGYLAHFLEQRADNRLIRPQAQYVGPDPASAAQPE